MGGWRDRAKFGGGGAGVPVVGSAHPLEVRDALNRVLQEGDRVVVPKEVIRTFQPFVVAKLEPMDEPGPDGLRGWMKIVLVTELPFMAPGGEPNNEFIRVARAPQPPAAETTITPVPDDPPSPADDLRARGDE